MSPKVLLTTASILLIGSLLNAAPPPGDAPPPTPFSRLEAAGTADEHDGADFVVVYDEQINHMHPTGVTYVDGYRLEKILTAAGCRDRSVLVWPFDPQSSHVTVDEVNVLRDGETIPVDLTYLRDLPAPQSAIYWRDRMLSLQLPRLQIGDGIEIKVSRKGYTYALLDGADGPLAPEDERYIPPMPGNYFDIVLFAESAPIVEKRYVLDLPADKRLNAEVYNGALKSSIRYTDERTEYAWWGLDLPALTHETRQPAASDFATKVVMSTAATWEDKSRWFFDVNRDQFEVTPAIRAKVEEIFAEMKLTDADEEKRAEALVHWVAQNIRYSGQTMGEGEGFTLHPSDMIFEQRSGVCKDIAAMLITMMRAAGMDSYAAMTMAGSRIDDLPADQFNHCVTALKLDDGRFRMYDPTWVPFNNSIWSLLETEQHYLVGTPEGEDLSRIRYSPPEESPLTVDHRAKLNADGDLAGRIRFDASGALDGRLRGLCNGRRDELRDRWAHVLSPMGLRIEGVVVDHHPTDDFSRDMWVTVDYRVPGFAMPVDGGLEFHPPLMAALMHDGSLFRAGATGWEDERDHDVLLYYTQLLEMTEVIELPKGYEVNDPPSVEEVDETYAAFAASAIIKGRTLTLITRHESRRRQVPPDGYPGFKASVDAAAAWADALVRAEKGGRR